MCDRHHGARKACEELLQPIDAFCIQVVGWLIEQQHIGLAEKQLAQRDSAFFTTREVANDGIPFRQAQCIRCNFQRMAGIIAGRSNDGLKLGLLGSELVKICIFCAVIDIHLLQPLFGCQHRPHRALYRFAHRVLRVELRLLWQITDLDTGHCRCFAFDLRINTRHDFEQGGFSRTVQAEHADFCAREKRERNIFQDMAFGWHDFANPVHGVNVLRHGVKKIRGQ